MTNGRRYGNRPSVERPNTSDDMLRVIIEQGDAIQLNGEADKWGNYFADGTERERLSSSQIRNVLDRLQRMRSFDLNQLQLLRPLLAYAAGRHGGKVRQMQQLSDRAIQLVKDNSQFVNFKNFFEAIVAYHRCHGGK